MLTDYGVKKLVSKIKNERGFRLITMDGGLDNRYMFMVRELRPEEYDSPEQAAQGEKYAMIDGDHRKIAFEKKYVFLSILLNF